MLKKLILINLLFLTSIVVANEVKVVYVEARCNTNKVCTFNVTLEHKDTSWKHFANKWEIYTPDNKLIATRILHHPHVNEQPFTRSLSSLHIPGNEKIIFIEAHDKKHGWSPNRVKIIMDKTSGNKFKINIR